MKRIGCHHRDGETMSPMTHIGMVDGALVATYSDGTRVLVAGGPVPVATDGDGGVTALRREVPVLEFDIGDEPVVWMRNDPMAVETPAARIEEAFGAWLATAVTAVDPQGMAFRIVALERAGMVLRDSDGDMDTFAKVEDGLLLSAVWDGDRLLGFAYGRGTPLVRPNGTFVGAEVDRVRARLAVMQSRLKGEWRIVAGEGERLGTDMSGLAVGGYVKVGVQPVHPMPDDYHAEWMWTKVTAIKGDRITATLQNHPSCFAISLECGNTMRFEARDVYAVESAEAAEAA